MNRTRILPFLFAVLLLVFSALPVMAESVPTMSGPELFTRLENKNLVLFDVRTDRDWDASTQKIRGAIRMEDGDISIAKQYPAESIFVLYCA